MRRYNFLTKDSVYEALNKLRSALLAASDGSEVEEIINGILTQDERIKIGRRIQAAQMIGNGVQYRKIASELKVGLTTVLAVAGKLQKYPKCFYLISKREEKVEAEFAKKAYTKTGGPKLIFKSKKYTGFSRKAVRR